MRKALVIGNWKMNGRLAANEALLNGLSSGAECLSDDVEVAVCPPSVYIAQAASLLQKSSIGVGAQNIATQASGAFTGEVSAEMLTDFGCEWVIAGHSERRSLYGESDQDVALKVAKAVESGIVPVICVGETLEEREAGQALARVRSQLEAALAQLEGDQLASIVVAYEPVWAIGTGLTATPDQAQEVHQVLRQALNECQVDLGDKVRILYGGSVNAANADSLFAQPDIDGGLIGGASLKVDDFLAICRAAAVES
ncbi:triose-phosphate isomerase [Marinobacterium sp. AK62]|uniref:Triosephosphate isomerase n=1 Tax=Marinobacterium alkalitolerans TaxID=1542925 RepID=A0ABS3ZEN0_9GAMM|nr:triose-phosphate isomerase [Marinobacterium alkalitolerans]MBP0049770.1 triose-phosphate isomerase [Marinobacterium alkalitolerans]